LEKQMKCFDKTWKIPGTGNAGPISGRRPAGGFGLRNDRPKVELEVESNLSLIGNRSLAKGLHETLT